MSDSIRLSEKHGFNPTLPVCEACGAPTGDVVLFGRLPGDAKAPRHPAFGFCKSCRGVVDQGGVVLVECRDGSERDPYRTGRV